MTHCDISCTVGWCISRHAKDAAGRRGVTSRSILECIAEPELAYPDRGREILTRGRLAVVVDRSDQVVVTVLMTGSDRWDEHEARTVFAA